MGGGKEAAGGSVGVKILEDQRIKAAPIEEEKKSCHEDEREGEELVDQLRLMIEMHEDQGDKSGLDRGEDHADNDVLTMGGELDSREPNGEDGADGENGTDPEDLADGFFDFFGAVSHDACWVKVTWKNYRR